MPTASGTAPSPEELIEALEENREPPHVSSLTDVASEAARVGIVDEQLPPEIPGQDALLTVGDPDVDPLDNEFSGEQVPGSTMPAPDQNNVDDIGRAYGLSDQDNGAFISTEELLERRDLHRQELTPAAKGP
jgi:hypothetical protein